MTEDITTAGKGGVMAHGKILGDENGSTDPPFRSPQFLSWLVDDLLDKVKYPIIRRFRGRARGGDLRKPQSLFAALHLFSCRAENDPVERQSTSVFHYRRAKII